MAEMRVVVQLSESEYATLVKDVTEVFENEQDPFERDRKLRMLLQYRGYMTDGYKENWSIPDVKPATSAKRGKAKKAKKAKTSTARKR